MATYSFKIKKGKYELNLQTTDKELLVSQFELWVKQAGDYARRKKAAAGKQIVTTQIKKEEEITKQHIEEQLNRAGLNKKQETPAEIKEETSTQKVLDIFYAPPQPQQPQIQEPVKTVAETPAGGVFDNILEKSLNNPQTELTFKASPTIKKDSAFLNFINSRKIERKIDYLLLTAYYFTQYEQKPRFTLKQLNAKLMQNIAVIIDHSVLQEAINRDYIECLPDLTGLVGASEYRLTPYGEKVLLDD